MSKPVVIEFIGDDDKLVRSFGRVREAAGETESKFSGVTGAMGKLAGAMAGVFVADKIVSGVRSWIEEARESEKITKLTEAAIKSTGGAANVTADQVGAYAEKLSNLTGIDDEVIQGGQNLLLTFTNVKNGVGEGNDIFNQASKAALDMSVVFGQDVSSSAVQLGKALNDPMKGITALSRVGVSFTAQQKEQIEAMMKVGNIAGAQKIILGELATQTGGAAQAAADPWQKFTTIMGNLKENLGTQLLPTLNKLLEWGAAHIPPVVNTLILGFNALFAAFKDGDVTSDGFVGVMERIGVTTKNVVTDVQSFVQAVRDNQEPIMIVTGLIAGLFIPHYVALGVAAIASAVKSGIAWTTQTAGAVAGAIAHSASVVGMVAGWVLLGLQAMLNAAKIAAAWLIAMGPIGLVIAAVVGLVALIIANWDTISRVTSDMWNKIKQWTGDAWNWIKDRIAQGLEFAKNLFLNFTGPGLIIKHWDTIKNATGAAFDWVADKVRAAIGALTGAISAFRPNMSWDAIKDGFRASINWIIQKWNGLSFSIPSVDIPGIGKVGGGTISTPDLPLFHSGGIVGDTRIMGGNLSDLRSDEVPAVLLTGEGVLPRNVMKALGNDGFNQLMKLGSGSSSSPSAPVSNPGTSDTGGDTYINNVTVNAQKADMDESDLYMMLRSLEILHNV